MVRDFFEGDDDLFFVDSLDEEDSRITERDGVDLVAVGLDRVTVRRTGGAGESEDDVEVRRMDRTGVLLELPVPPTGLTGLGEACTIG